MKGIIMKAHEKPAKITEDQRFWEAYRKNVFTAFELSLLNPHPASPTGAGGFPPGEQCRLDI